MPPPLQRLGERVRGLAAAAAIALVTLLPTAARAEGNKAFDHVSTGFPLTGQHQSTRCEDCHVRGIFKGTPRQCAACHSPGTLVTAVIIPNNHFPASQPCSTCHTTSSFYGTRYEHDAVPAGTCASCHNGTFATGKNPGHPVTAASCDVCHTSVSFVVPFVPTGHLPTTQACSTCHSNAAFVPGVMNHAGTAGTCDQCHAPAGEPYVFEIPAFLIINGQTVVLSTSPQRIVEPMSQGGLDAAKTTGAVNHIPAAASCDQCHTNGVFTVGSGFKGGRMKHAAVAGTSCSTCHDNPIIFAGTGLGPGGEPFQIPGAVGTPGAGNHIPINGLDCAASGCHAASDVETVTGTGFASKTTPALSAAGHTSVDLPCQSCHAVGMTWKLSDSTMVTATSAHIPPANIAGGAPGCSACHSATSFGSGGFKITSSPVLTKAGHAAVAGFACETCHEANAADLTFQGVLGNIYLRPDTANSGLSKGLGQDPAHGTGNQATEDCGACHTTTPPFSNPSTLTEPANHIKLVSPTPSCNDCHAAGYAPGLTTMKHADAAGTCTSCHYTSTVFAGTGQGTDGQPWQIPGPVGTPGAADHFPINGADCASSGCHAVSDTLTATGAGFVLAGTPVLSAAGHTSVNLPCASCHTIGMSWKLGAAATLVTPAAAHIPPDNAAGGAVACSSCHSATSFGTGGFKITASPVMSVSAHAAVSSLTCETCHEANAADLTFQGVLANIYLRPDTATSGLSKGLGQDPAHGTGNQATQDCSVCHSTAPPFASVTLPANHIKLISPTPSCSDCHAAGYAPGLSGMKHADAAGTCTSCHYTTTVFAGTGQGTDGQPWQIPGSVGTPGAGNHIPINSVDCAGSGCHSASDTLTATGAGFVLSGTPVLSAAGHTTVNLPCATCHTIGMSWKLGASATLVTPAATHIPPDNASSGTVACSSCHSATSFGTGGFKITSSPVLSVAAHSAVAAAVPACDSCHESANVTPADLTFQGVGANIYLRPNNGANSGLSQGTDTAHVGQAATGDCGGCHTTTPPFSNATSKPAGHIAVAASAACATCHTTGAFNTVVLPMPHSGVVSGTCGSCHGSGLTGSGYLGPFAGPTALGGTYTAGEVAFVPKQIISSPAIGASGGHIPPPSADDCSVCHLSTSAFGPGTAMVHTNITSGCATCHSAGATWYGESYTASPLVTTNGVTLSPVHVPITLGGNPACEKCHSTTNFTSFGTATTVNHSSGAFMTYTSGQSGSSTPTCKSCHGPSGARWYGVSLNTETVGNHANSTSSQDCINCHSTSSFSGAVVSAAARRPVERASAGPGRRPPGPGQRLVAADAPFTHVGVLPGGCAACHAPGSEAPATPAGHLATNLSCDACHRTSSWLPALFTHQAVAAGSCAGCHAANGATAKPAHHLLTSRGCDSCHESTSTWLPVRYAHLDTVYTPHPASVGCAACHASGTEQATWKYPNLKPGCAGCHGPQFGATAARRARGAGQVRQ
jgi:hypothetical protein